MAPGRSVGSSGAGKAGKPGKAAKPAGGRKPSIGGGGAGGRAGKVGSSRKGAPVGSGGQGKDRLKGRGPTPPAEERKGHPAARRKAAADKGARRQPSRTRRPGQEVDEVVVGRNPVVEALRFGVPATGLLVARGVDHDARVREAISLAADLGIPTREAVRPELDRLADGALHQGLALQVSPYEYAHPDDLLQRALSSAEPALLVALDGITDPRNLGAILRSAAAFGAHGVVVPERRAAGVTAAAWRTSAGAAAHLPVARAVNLSRVLKAWSEAGVTVVGLDGEGDLTLDDLEVAVDPICLVIGAEGEGLGRLVAERCNLVAQIPMSGPTESLNASVAASVALAEVARRRRVTTP